MNLHAICAGAIGSVNPFISGTVKVSNGTYTTARDGTQTPNYTTTTGVKLQVQALTGKDIRQIDGLNLQGTLCAIYASGAISGVIRASSKGGDLIVIASGAYAGTWLCSQVLEQWSDGGPASWCKFVATLQNNA